MNISVEDKSNVDKILTISATREELEPRFDKAYRAYRKKIDMPGFRRGQIPLSIIKKRFGKEIETEEINNYIQEVFKEEVAPKYNPVGEPRFEDLKWEDDELEVKIEIGVKPAFEVKDLSTFTVDKMVHDVTDEDVEEEIQKSLERSGTWVESEEPIGEKSRVTVDAVPVDDKGNLQKDDQDVDKELDLSNEENKEFREALADAKTGDVVDVSLGEGNNSEKFRLTVKKVMNPDIPQLDEHFVRETTNGEVSSVEEYRSQIKSRIQSYYDQVSADMVKQEIMDLLIEAHKEIEIPEVLLNKFQNAYLDRMKQQQGQTLPEDVNEEEYKESIKEDAEREARWAFIMNELSDKYEDIEINEEDIDERLASEAARYGLSTEMVRNFYSQSGDKLENLRLNIRADKLFDRILQEVTLNELDKAAYEEKKKKERNDKNN